jgi:hypothetical protein
MNSASRAPAAAEDEIRAEVQRGARFVVYRYCVSFLLFTSKRASDVYYLRPGERAWGKRIGYALLSLLLGPWGLPWGPIYTVQCIAIDLRGGEDVTAAILSEMSAFG